jgi:hypothetical protein
MIRVPRPKRRQPPAVASTRYRISLEVAGRLTARSCQNDAIIHVANHVTQT